MFDFENFKATLYDAAENAEEKDFTVYDIADLAVDYVVSKLINKNSISKGENNMSKLEKDERGFWHYTSKNGVVYDVDESSADINIITDVFSDFMNDNVIFHWKLVDYVCGDLGYDPYDIKEWLDDRIPYYEEHERIIKFLGDDNILYQAYIGTDKPMPWCPGKEISIKEMNKMFSRDKKLSEDEATQFLSTIWYGTKRDNFKEMAKEVADKLYNLKFDNNIKYIKIGKLESIEDYVSAWENGNWYLYYNMENLIQDEWERSFWEEGETFGDCAKQCYDEIGHTIFRLNHCVIQYYA